MEHTFTTVIPQWLSHPAMGELFGKMIARLLLAAILGGLIGLERELRHRPAGLRTNMLICFGSAMFTVLSIQLGGPNDTTRIAAQIISGIGFIGAGSILRDKGGVTGLTTAAAIFAVAAIGMACGGGLYMLGVFATMLIFLALLVLGWVERRFNLKPLRMDYSIVTDKSPQEIVEEINRILEEQGKELSGMRLSKVDGKERIIFTVGGTRSEHQGLMNRLHQSTDLRGAEAIAGPEIE
jgi:putative Mg2+ transporter-C (MgtC) family protein